MSRKKHRGKSFSNSGAIVAPQSHAGSYGGNGSGYDAIAASTMRGAIIWPQLDTRKEISSYTRIEIMRKARALTENIGFPNHILYGLADLIGYLTPMAATRDRKWNELANANFRDRQSIPEVFDASGKFGFWEYQTHLNVASFRDGDVMPVLTKTSSGTARLATYEAHQIAQPYGSEMPGKWRDGVRVNQFNRHEAYNLTDPDDRTVNNTILASNAIYYAHFKKIGHTRPVSILAGSINHLQDIGEIVRDIKYGVKVRNQIPLSMESAVGSQGFASGATSSVLEQVKKGNRPVTGENGQPTTESYNYEEIMHGGNIPRLPPGVSLKALIDAAPHPNQLALISHLIRDVSWNVGVAPEILWDINSLRGANNRLLNSKLQRWIGARLMHQRNFVRRYWVYAIACEMKMGRLPMPSDPEWWKVAMLPQGSITADRGREGKLDIELVANGMMSLQQFFAKEGQDWLTEIRQISEENAVLSELGLVVGDIMRNRAGREAPEKDDEPDDEDPAADEDDEDPKKKSR